VRFSDLREYLALKPILKEPWRFVRTWRKPAGPDPSFIRFRNGLDMRVRGDSTDRRIFHLIFARDEYRLDGIAPGSWDTVIDVGAHIGIFAWRVAALARRVLCFEPVPANFELLRENLAHPPFSHVRCFPKAVAGRSGTLDFYLSPADPSAHTLLPGKEGCTMATRVEAVTLAQVFQEHQVEACDLLKLDCEGGEYEILDALPQDLWPRIRRIRMEFHRGPQGWDSERLARLLKDRGFTCEVEARRTHPDRGLLFAASR